MLISLTVYMFYTSQCTHISKHQVVHPIYVCVCVCVCVCMGACACTYMCVLYVGYFIGKLRINLKSQKLCFLQQEDSSFKLP